MASVAAEQTGEGFPQSSAAGGEGGSRDGEGADRSSAAIVGDLYCPECGYNLRTLTGDRCPECGEDIQVVRRRGSQIPWTYRDKEGSFRAYWKTVWLVIFRNKRFCLEINRPVDAREARLFRWVTVLHAYLPLLILTLAGALMGYGAFTLEVWVYAGVIHLGIVACIVWITAVPYYALYHRDAPLEKQHRAAVLTLYSAAPLAWMFLVMLLAIAGMIAGQTLHGNYDLVCYLSAGGVLVILLAVMVSEVQRLINRMFPDPRTVLRMTLKLAGLWLGAVFLTLVGIPLAALLLALVFYSLR